MIPINPTLKLVIALVLVGAYGALQAIFKVEPSWTVLGTISQGVLMLEVFFTVPPSAARRLKAAAVKPLSVLLLLACTSCLSSAPIVPVTPANQAQVTTCENAATLHNDFVIGDFAFTGSAGALGAVGALASDPQAKTDLAIAAAGTGALAVVASSIVALSASDFANNQCPNVVGQLPVAQPAGGK